MVNFEHSWGDGVAILRAGTEMMRRVRAGDYTVGCLDGAACAVDGSDASGRGGGGGSETGGVAVATTGASATAPRRLQWTIPASLAAAVGQCASEHERASGALDVSVLSFERFGAEAVKR